MDRAHRPDEMDSLPPRTTTEIIVEGANCNFCMNETLDLLRRQPGVLAAHSSMTGGCLVVEHEQLPVDDLLDLVRRHLHGVAMSSIEPVMVAVDPRVAELHCTHR